LLAIQGSTVTGTILFLNIINSEGYSRQAPTWFIFNLSDDENEYRFFQENGATAHIANNSVTIYLT